MVSRDIQETLINIREQEPSPFLTYIQSYTKRTSHATKYINIEIFSPFPFLLLFSFFFLIFFLKNKAK